VLKSTVCGLNGLRPTLRAGPPDLNPQPLRALAPAASFRGRFAGGSLSKKKYGTAYFSVLEQTSK
jgi:hypothetical protein